LTETIYKIQEIGCKNFGKFKSFKANISPDVTFFCGWNGAGKSTAALDIVWSSLSGIAKKNMDDNMVADRFRFIGDYGKSAKADIVIEEINTGRKTKIERVIRKDTTELRITDHDGKKLDKSFVKKIFNSLFLNLTAFSELEPVQQAKSLGIDTSSYDAKRKEIEIFRRDAGRESKKNIAVYEDFKKGLPADFFDSDGNPKEFVRIDTAKIHQRIREAVLLDQQKQKDNDERHQAQCDRILSHNERVDGLTAEKQSLERLIIQDTAEIEALRDRISKLQDNIEYHRSEHDKINVLIRMEAPVREKIEPTDISMIEKEYSEAEKHNDNCVKIETLMIHEFDYKKSDKAHQTRQAEIDEIDKKRMEYIQSCNLPFSNMTIDTEGGLLVDNRPFSNKYFSAGEIIKYTAMILAKNPPELRYVFIENASLIDPENLESLLEYLNENDFQVICEVVTDRPVEDRASIVLKDMEVIDGESASNTDGK